MLTRLDKRLAKDSVQCAMFRAYVEACIPVNSHEAAADYLLSLRQGAVAVLEHRYHPVKGEMQAIVGVFNGIGMFNGKVTDGASSCIDIAKMAETTLMRRPHLLDEMKFAMHHASVKLLQYWLRHAPKLQRS